ncbi:MAG: hypothetical protein ACI9FB_003033 [Candidatus Azotimanducaceae bacterium]|jgi:hypothetical protein
MLTHHSSIVLNYGTTVNSDTYNETVEKGVSKTPISHSLFFVFPYDQFATGGAAFARFASFGSL